MFFLDLIRSQAVKSVGLECMLILNCTSCDTTTVPLEAQQIPYFSVIKFKSHTFAFYLKITIFNNIF